MVKIIFIVSASEHNRFIQFVTSHYILLIIVYWCDIVTRKKNNIKLIIFGRYNNETQYRDDADSILVLIILIDTKFVFWLHLPENNFFDQSRPDPHVLYMTLWQNVTWNHTTIKKNCGEITLTSARGNIILWKASCWRLTNSVTSV